MSTISKMKKLLDTTLPATSDFPTKITRNAGGSTRKNSPFVSGGLIFYLLAPATLGAAGEDTTAANTTTSNGEIGQIFHCSAENFTPHTRSITTNTVPGLWGIKSSFPTTQDISTTFSITMREWTDMPILKTLRSWQNIMFDANHGISLANSHLASDYKGDAIVMYIKPNFKRAINTQAIIFSKDMIEEMYWYTGVFPTTGDIPASDISAPDLQTIAVTFSFDGHPFTMENTTMLDKAVALITSYTEDINKVDSTGWFKMDQNSGAVDTAFIG